MKWIYTLFRAPYYFESSILVALPVNSTTADANLPVARLMGFMALAAAAGLPFTFMDVKSAVAGTRMVNFRTCFRL